MAEVVVVERRGCKTARRYRIVKSILEKLHVFQIPPVILAAVCLAGCSFEPSHANTYPCHFGVYSRFDRTVYIERCEGIGSVYPDGYVTKTTGPAPSSTFFFPRQRWLPERIRIHWRIETDRFTQDIDFPQVEKGSDGMLRLELSEDNIWSLSFQKDSTQK